MMEIFSVDEEWAFLIFMLIVVILSTFFILNNYKEDIEPEVIYADGMVFVVQPDANECTCGCDIQDNGYTIATINRRPEFIKTGVGGN